MRRQFLEILLAAALLALLGLVAASAGAVLWAGTTEGSAGSGLSVVLYAPFALLALVLPALAAPVARRVLAPWSPEGGRGHPWPSLWRFAALFIIAEALSVAARLAGGVSAPLPPGPVHALLAIHAAIAAFVLGRSFDHADPSPRANT